MALKPIKYTTVNVNPDVVPKILQTNIQLVQQQEIIIKELKYVKAFTFIIVLLIALLIILVFIR
jgi:hypothetical protein